MAAPRPCADPHCCSRPVAVPGVQQTLEEMDFERGEAAARPQSPPARTRGKGPSPALRGLVPEGSREKGSQLPRCPELQNAVRARHWTPGLACRRGVRGIGFHSFPKCHGWAWLLT